jgi:hypothetical protein
MKIKELIGTLLADSSRVGTFALPDLIKYAQSQRINGIAVAVTGDREFDLAFQDGEPEGAVLSDEKGTLYGDKAIMLLSGDAKFDLYSVNRDLVDRVAVGCRILEKGHLRKTGMEIIPEIGKKSEGLGVVSIAVQRNGEPQNGVRVSMRRAGQILANDVTTQNGMVSFKLLFGKYDCVVQDRTQMIHTFHIIFDPKHTRITLEI